MVTRISGTPVERHERSYRFQGGGWSTALKLAPIVSREAFNAGLVGAVFCIDNDGAVPHDNHAPQDETDCRLCALERAARCDEVRRWPRPALKPLAFVFAVPVQVMETWLLVGRGTPPPGNQDLVGRTPNERRQLKQQLYGTQAPDERLMLNVAIPIVERMNLDDVARRSGSFRAFRAVVQAEFVTPP